MKKNFRGRSASSEQDHSEGEQTEKSPLVSAKLETFAKILFNRTLSTQDSSSSTSNARDNSSSPTRLGNKQKTPKRKYHITLYVLEQFNYC